MMKRKLSMNGWDTKEGIRKNKNVNKKTQEQDRRMDKTFSEINYYYLKQFIPLYKVVSWI